VADFLPKHESLSVLRKAAETCERLSALSPRGTDNSSARARPRLPVPQACANSARKIGSVSRARHLRVDVG
jgi:hypothetical protein